MNNNKYIDRITIQSPKEDKDFEEYSVFSPKDLDESLTFSNEWSSEKGIHFVIRNGKLVGITKNGNPVMAQNGVIYTESTEPFSFTIGGNTYNVESGPQWTDLNVEGITSLASMFKGINSLTSLSLCMDTSQLRGIGYTFAGCTNLISLDLSQWNTTNVTNMSSMFYGCSSLATLDVSNWDTAACTNMGYMFISCSSLTSLDVGNWNTSACMNMSSMFYGCSSLATLDVSGWDFSKCTTTYRFVFNCKSLSGLKLGGVANPLLTDIRGMFSRSGFTTLDINDFDVSAVVKMDSVFSSLLNITEIIIPHWTTQSAENMSELFGYCTKLQKVDISGFIMSNVTDCRIMFYMCDSLHTLLLPNMGQLKADTDTNKVISFTRSPLGTAGEESRQALLDLFSYDRVANGLTNTLTVQLSAASKALLTPEEIAAITAKGYTIA